MKIQGIAAVVPSRQITNDCVINEIVSLSRGQLSKLKLKLVETILRQCFSRSGTQVRYIRDKGEKAVDVTVKAGLEALQKANMKPEDIDLLIFTGVGRGWLEPAQANLFQSLLGLKNATCFDVLDACASWMRSMSVAQCFIDQGLYKNVMILNSEFNNREFSEFSINDPEILRQSFAQYTIGEAATATILSADENKGNFYFSFTTYGEAHDLCKIPLPNADQYHPGETKEGEKWHLKPMVFFARSTELLTFTIEKLVSHFRSDPTLFSKTYDIIFGHDVSEFSTERVLKRLKLDPRKMIRTHSLFGNTVSASIPLAITRSVEQGKLKDGMSVLMICGSAGVSTAFCSFSY